MTASTAHRIHLYGQAARMWWFTGGRSTLTLFVIFCLGILAFAVARASVGKAHAEGTAALSFALPAFFWWAAAGDLLLARAPASSVALVPGYRRAYRVVALMHFAFTTVLPAACVASFGGAWPTVLAAGVAASGLGAWAGQRGVFGLLGLLVVAGFAGLYSVVALSAAHLSLPLMSATGLALFAAWWIAGPGARPNRRWRTWSERADRDVDAGTALAYGTTYRTSRLLVALDTRLHETLDRATIARFRAAATPARSRAMLALAFGRLSRQIVATLLVCIGIAAWIVAAVAASAPSTGVSMMARLPDFVLLVHVLVVLRQRGWLATAPREAELLLLVPRLDPQRRYAAMTAWTWMALHLKLGALALAAWVVAAAFVALDPAVALRGAAFLAFYAALGSAIAGRLLVAGRRFEWRDQLAFVGVYSLWTFLRAVYEESPHFVTLGTVASIAAIAAFLLSALYAYRRIAQRVNPFEEPPPTRLSRASFG